MILRIRERVLGEAVSLQPPIDVAVKGEPGRFGGIAPIVEIEGLKPLEIHGREIVANMHQTFQVFRSLGFGDDRKLVRIIAQARLCDRDSRFGGGHIHLFCRGE